MPANSRAAAVVRFGWLALLVIFAHLALSLIDRSIATWVLRSAPHLRYGPLETIGEMGDAVWYLVPAAVLALGGLAGARMMSTEPAKSALRWLGEAGSFVFIAVAGSGLLVNAMKMLVGRSRPDLLNPETPFSLSPFTLEAGFHSFPSGHANTAFAAALALGFLLPRMRMPFLALATLIAATRSLVAVHYFSDVVAGAAVAVLTTFWLRRLFAERGWAFRYAADGTVVPRWRWEPRGECLGTRVSPAERVAAGSAGSDVPGDVRARG